jgi:flagellar biosynthetic protein FlhB
MAEQGTEAGTPQRKKKAKDSGDVVRSRELLSAMALLGGLLVMGAMTSGFVSGWGRVYAECLRSAAVGSVTETEWAYAVRGIVVPALAPVALVMVTSFLGALLVGVAQGGGITFHPNALELKLSKLNPIANLGNMVSLRSLTRVVKSLVPAAVMAVMGWGVLKELMVPMPVMSLLRLPATFQAAYGLAIKAAWVTLGWSGLDYCVEYIAWNKRMKMTKQQMRDEMKEAMGNPQVKGQIRRLQRAMRKRRMKADISRASVVITNPTHYAVALEFSFETMSAPTVLAKGRDFHAKEIREEAEKAGIPLIENPPLARSLYKMVEPGQSIPFELYSAVAGILAYLYRQKVEEKMRADRDVKQRQAQRDREQRTAYKTAVAMRGMGGVV